MRRADRAIAGLRRLLLAAEHPGTTSLPACDDFPPRRHARGVKQQANDVRQGKVLEVEGRLMLVTKFTRAPGTGRQLGAVLLEMRDLANRSKHPLRLRPSDLVDVVRLEERTMQCLYIDDGVVHCMHPDTFEQVSVDAALFGAGAQFLVEGLQLALCYHEGEPVSGTVPPTVTLIVEEVAPHMKGESVTSSYKPARLQNGVMVALPPFVKRGEAVVVDTASGEFVRRAG